MNGQGVLSLTDVHRALQERFARGAYPIGSRLPTCRALAVDLGSNASTVDRAIQRLAEAGLVRTLPRRGSFVVALPRGGGVTAQTLAEELATVLGRARRAGLARGDIREMVETALAGLDVGLRVALVECNTHDAVLMSTMIQNASGVRVEPVLLDRIEGRHLDDDYDVVCTPLFHLHDIADAVADLDAVVEINMSVTGAILRRLATLDPSRRVAVATPTDRGVERISALVRQYFSGEVLGYRLGGDDPGRLAGIDVLVRANAGELSDQEACAVGEVLHLEWELDPDFASTFRGRVHRAVERSARVDQSDARL